MKQIKTIKALDHTDFDVEVNNALADGWELVKRYHLILGIERAVYYFAELEKEIITKEKQTCENCKHHHLDATREPCASCYPDMGVWNWEEAEWE